MAEQQEFDIRKHIFVPQHTILEENEAEAFLLKYNISKRQMPKIKINDPALKTLNPKAGDIIKIMRKSPVDVKAVFYRVVVQN